MRLKNLILAEMALQKRNKKIKYHTFSCYPTGHHKIEREGLHYHSVEAIKTEFKLTQIIIVVI